MILIHLAQRGGGDVGDVKLSDLIAVQTAVREHFGWNYHDDVISANEMGKAMSVATPFGVVNWSPIERQKTLNELKLKLASADKVVIVGASANEHDIDDLDADECVVIAADGSVGAVGGVANLACVVTDFDGNPYLEKAADGGTIFIAHAHGDNRDTWEQSLTRWSRMASPPRLILTHQVTESIEGMENYGGFTDGDRAVCLALALGVGLDRISLVGFSTTVIGKWSGQTEPVQKFEKLKWMLKILQVLGLGDQVSTNASLEH